MISLYEGSKSLKDLQKCVGSNPQTINAKLRELIREELVERNGWGTYMLTPKGRLVTSKIEGIINSLDFLEKHREFWLTHKIDAIPEPLLQELIGLPNLDVVGDGLNPFEAQAFISEVIKGAEKKIIGISPVITAEWAETIIEMAERGVEISLIVNEDILSMVRKGYKEYPLLSHRNIEYKVDNDVQLGFISNGKTISLSFFNGDTLDIRKRVVSSDSSAIKWGEKLFKYYWERRGP